MHCGEGRFKANGAPARVMPYWPASACIGMLCNDPRISAWMLDTIDTARAAASAERTTFRDWYDCDGFRAMWEDGTITDDTLFLWMCAA